MIVLALLPNRQIDADSCYFLGTESFERMHDVGQSASPELPGPMQMVGAVGHRLTPLENNNGPVASGALCATCPCGCLTAIPALLQCAVDVAAREILQSFLIGPCVALEDRGWKPLLRHRLGGQLWVECRLTSLYHVTVSQQTEAGRSV